jgi:hypothetical protein
MARFTDTRQQVRHLADQLIAEGQTPSPTLIREMLGKGSLNTIVSELKEWRSDREKASGKPSTPPTAAERTADALSRVGASEAAGLVKEGAEVAAAFAAAAAEMKAAIALLHSLPNALATLTQEVANIHATVRDDRRWMAAEIDKAQARFDGMQRYALQSIEGAREESRSARERLRLLEDGGMTREMLYKRRIDELMSTIARLQGRLEERGQRWDDIPSPERLTEAELRAAAGPRHREIKGDGTDSH